MLTSRVVRKKYVNVPSKLTGPTKVKVGFVAGESSSEEIQKAVWNEFGTRGGASGGGWGGPIPERPFMRNAMRENQTDYRTSMLKAARSVLRGHTTLRDVLSLLGTRGARDIADAIDGLKSPPNSPVTIALKGSSNPLVDTGMMMRNAKWEVIE